MKRWMMLMVSAIFLLGSLAQAADLGKTLVALDGSKVAVEETALGNFVADAVRNAGGADVAILHAMAFRANALIPADVVVDDQAIRKSLASPSSRIAVLKLTPAQLRNIMQHALSKYPTAYPAFLQFSGMTVSFNSANQSENRLVSISIDGAKLDLMDNKTTYKVAMPRELALGAVGYVMFFTDEVTKGMGLKETTLLDAITTEFARFPDGIKPAVGERLQDVNPQKK